MSQTSASSSAPPPAASSFEEPNIPELVQASTPQLPPEGSEFERVESLLFARTRSHGTLQRELERRDRLFREALVRMSTSTSKELSALRAVYDAAVARAIEAEVGKAELTFALDETQSQLTAAQPAAGVGVQTRAPGVYASGADLKAALTENAELRRSLDALRGELNGVRARANESEEAWQSACVLGQKLQQRLGTAQQRVDELRAESAELILLAQTRAARIAELTQAAAFDQQEIRTLRAQVTAASAAQAADGEAREADRQLWNERLREHEAREQAAWNAAAAAGGRSEERLREFLATLEQPLRELDASLDALNAPGRTSSGEIESPAAQSGTRFSVSATQPPPAAESKAPSARRRS